MDALAEGGDMTPSEIIKNMKSSSYKNQDNAIRSVNNLLRRLMQDGLVDRNKVGKTYKYKVSSRFQSVLVNA
jgi:predicted transcriptional regulator